MDAPIKLVVPADPNYVHVVRTVATGFAAHLALSFDTVGDLRLAVGECCNRLLAAAIHPTTLALVMDASHEDLIVRVSLGTSAVSWPPTDPLASLSSKVISSLADTTEEELDGGIPTIVSTWHLLAAARHG